MATRSGSRRAAAYWFDGSHRLAVLLGGAWYAISGARPTLSARRRRRRLRFLLWCASDRLLARRASRHRSRALRAVHRLLYSRGDSSRREKVQAPLPLPTRARGRTALRGAAASAPRSSDGWLFAREGPAETVSMSPRRAEPVQRTRRRQTRLAARVGGLGQRGAARKLRTGQDRHARILRYHGRGGGRR